MKYLSAIAALFAIYLVTHFTYETFRVRGQIFGNLKDHWTVFVNDHELKNQTLPLVLDSFTDDKRGAKASFTRTFEVPAVCHKIPCYLYFGQVGDLSKVYLDGHLVKEQGYADGYKSLARYHPLFVELPSGRWSDRRSLTVKLDAESLYGLGFGVPSRHVFIGDYAAVTTTARAMAMDTVVSPLMQALVLSILGLLALISWQLSNFDRAIFLFGIFALFEAAFLLSFSYLPREFLPVHTASAIHFSLRILADWSLLECINSLLPIRRWILQTMRSGFILYLFWMLALFLRHAEYPEFVEAIRTYAPLIIGVPIAGFISAAYYWNENRKLLSKRYMDVELLGVTFLILSAFQIWDTGIFWGIFHGIYTVKFYLVPLAFVFALVHIFRSIRSFEALKRSKAENEKDAILGRIAMEFSHDIKSPLAALRDAAGVALHGNDPEFMKTVLIDVESKARTVTDRIQELFNYAKGQINTKESVSATKFFDDIKFDLATELREKNIELQINVPDQTVVLDPVSMKRLVQNLVQNAIRASPEKSSISINAKYVDQKFIFSVHDFGIGIDKTDIAHIFDPYFTTDRSKGTGLGLSIVERIARLHGGRVEVYSNKGMGSTFVVEIPQ